MFLSHWSWQMLKRKRESLSFDEHNPKLQTTYRHGGPQRDKVLRRVRELQSRLGD